MMRRNKNVSARSEATPQFCFETGLPWQIWDSLKRESVD